MPSEKLSPIEPKDYSDTGITRKIVVALKHIRDSINNEADRSRMRKLLLIHIRKFISFLIQEDHHPKHLFGHEPSLFENGTTIRRGGEILQLSKDIEPELAKKLMGLLYSGNLEKAAEEMLTEEEVAN